MEEIRLYFTILLILSSATVLLLSTFALQKRPSSGRPELFLALCGFCVAIYDLGYAMEIHAADLERVLFWVRFEHVGIQMLPPLWLLFARGIMGEFSPKRSWREAVFFILPLISLFASQSLGTLNLLHPNPRLASGEVLSLFEYDRGWAMYAVTVFQGIYLFGGFFLFSRGLIRGKPIPRSQAAIYWLGSMIPWLSSFIYNLGKSPFNADLTPIALSFSLILFTAGFLKFGILDVTPLARNLIFEGLEDGVVVIDARGRIVDRNAAADRIITGLEGMEPGSLAADILPDDPALRAMLEPDAPASAEIATSRGSDTRTYQVTCSSLKNRRGKSLGRLINFHDISRMKELQDKLEILSVRDSLTGLYNRRYLNEFTTKEIGRTKAIGDDLSVIMLDLDHFKRVNDTWGHAAGDIVLKSVASICLATVREGDVVGRLGGEEILLVLPHTVLDEALDIAERLRTAIEKSEVAFEGQSIRVTASFGAASICTSRSELKDLLIMADLALYRAKEAGRNRVCGNACVDPS